LLEARRLANKEVARLGDAIVNFLVSGALTLATGRPHGVKVSNSTLRRAYRRLEQAGLVQGRPPRGFGPEDLLEALIGLLWLKGRLSLDGVVLKLAKELSNREKPEKAVDECLARVLADLLSSTVGSSLPL